VGIVIIYQDISVQTNAASTETDDKIHFFHMHLTCKKLWTQVMSFKNGANKPRKIESPKS